MRRTGTSSRWPDRGTARAPDRWWLVLAAALAVFMAQLDMYVVNAALPVIGADFDTPASTIEWVVLGYLLPLVALTLPTGRWLDQVGNRSALTLSTLGFVLASVAAGLAPDVGWMIGARAVQGVFAAMLFALLPAITTRAVRPQLRGRAMGVVTTVGSLGAVSGPALGGLVVDTVGWPWIFYGNLPVALTVIGIGRAQLPPGPPLRLPTRSSGTEAVLVGGAAAAVLLGLSLAAGHGLGWLGLAVVSLPLVAAWAWLPVSRPVRALLRTPGLPGPHLALLCVATATGLLALIIPFLLHRVSNASAATVGLTLLALPLATAVLGPVAGALADRTGPRPVAITGVAVLTTGLVSLLPLSPAWEPVHLGWRLAVVGVGTGLFLAPNQTLAMSHAPSDRLITTGATISLARQLGFALGPALGTTAWALAGYTVSGLRAALALLVLVCGIGLVATARVRSVHIRRNETSGAQPREMT